MKRPGGRFLRVVMEILGLCRVKLCIFPLW